MVCDNLRKSYWTNDLIGNSLRYHYQAIKTRCRTMKTFLKFCKVKFLSGELIENTIICPNCDQTDPYSVIFISLSKNKEY